MANIAVTTYCADDMICESHQNITIDQLRAILG